MSGRDRLNDKTADFVPYCIVFFVYKSFCIGAIKYNCIVSINYEFYTKRKVNYRKIKADWLNSRAPPAGNVGELKSTNQL